ncbi:HTTM domain-containing protein [Nonomuraea sp. NPDC050790]|uniref:HTTM domain-containing protein n=1 Tax=Nonomuraea sp. NPDC050790 TaxID=3364371 RepID=UPI0037B78A46
MAGALTSWWFPQAPLRRVRILAVIVYLFLPVDMILFTGGVWGHAHGSSIYRPVLLARLLHLPGASEPLVYVLFGVVVLGALVAAAGRLPRAAGYAVALGYTYWAVLAMSYGKVDHDHLALIVTLFVLPTVGVTAREVTNGRAQAAGWALRCVRIAVVATYFLSAYAKIRHGGWEWPNGATFQWAVTRRGTFFGHVVAGLPGALLIGQWLVLLAETASPVLLFLRGRLLYAGVAFFLAFHFLTWAAITIHFLPHVICLAAFLPLERIVQRARRGAAGEPVPVARDQAVDAMG